MSATVQKFHRGDIVAVAKDLGPSMSHFESDFEGIVIGSYDDAYGGGNTDSYTIMAEDGNEISWYHEPQLTLIRHGSEADITARKDARDQLQAQQSKLPWIIANWSDESMPHASLQALADAIGFGDLWGRHGEGMDLWTNSVLIMGAFDGPMKTGDMAAVEARIAELSRVLPGTGKV